MLYGLNRNVWLLSIAQAFLLGTNLASATVVGLAGVMLAPDPALKTLPFALVIVGSALATYPASLFMKRTSRRTGFMVGAALGVIGFGIAIFALYTGNFWALAVATFIQGIYTAFAYYYRFAAVDAVQPAQAGKAISMVLAGGVLAVFMTPTALFALNNTFTGTPYIGAYVFMMVMSILTLLPVALLKLPEEENITSTDHGRSFREIFSNPVAQLAVLNAAVGWSLMILVMAVVPLQMSTQGFDFADTAIVIQWHVLAMYGPSFFTATLITRYGVGKILLLGYGALALAILSGFVGTDFEHFASVLVALGLGWNFLFVGGTTLLTRVYRPEEKARVQGVNEMVIFSVAATSGLLAGPLLDLLGWAGLLTGAAITLVLLVIITLATGLRIQRAAEAVQVD